MKKDIFWYKQPADKWIEALPLGNGRMGAMVYGGALEETIQIDESSFWSGAASSENNRSDSYELMWKIRRELLNENYEEADRLGHDFIGRKNQYGTNMPVGNLKMTLLDVDQRVSGYERSLSLAQGIATTQFHAGNIGFEREVFVSNPASVAAVRIHGDGRFSMCIRYEGIGHDARIENQLSLKDAVCCRIVGDARESLHSNGNCGVHLEGCILAAGDGEFAFADGSMYLKSCTDVTLFIDLETDMFLKNPAGLALERVQAAFQKGYERLKQEHIADVEPLYKRMSLSLGGEEKCSIPTDERIAKVAAGEPDPDLYRLMFSYGRYLLIASSREDSPLPTHMGGIWNDNIYNNIDCTQDMHVDMNLQMQYWAAAQCNLPECYTPYFKYLENIVIPSGRQAAKEVYHARGWAAHVVTNPWGFASLGWSYNWGVFSLGGVWLALLAWDYYEYTNDLEWLKNTGFSILEGAAAFAVDYCFYDEKSGYYMAGPSYSPENMFRTNGKDYFLSLSTTCDVLLIREILEVYRKASLVVGKENDSLAEEAKKVAEKLPPYQIGKYGQLMEWFHDFEEPIPNHRHTSHLLGIYPFRQIVPECDKELAEAVKVTILRRHEDFEITSWGMNMLVGYYARLGMGQKAHEMITETFQRIVKPNMAAVMSDETSMWCGTWELDGNTGLTSAMAEMLVQSFEDEIILLPALPKEWPDGSLEGVRIKGGHELNLIWKDSKPVRMELHAASDGKKSIVYAGKKTEIAFLDGDKVILLL
ncbi:MAG: glycoside hydrolase family 95 protein [Lachnospiraceae bacterium]|nr:glycoside hydrolase family 95 protein [Lachnospiraceae bacterium]